MDIPLERFETRWVEFGSPEYDAMLDLRDEVLRRPLGLRIDRTKLETERAYRHLATWQGKRCVGTMVLSQESPTIVRMRAVSVHPDSQGRGIGRMMVKEFEREALAMGASEIMLHARQNAIPFYLGLGYEAEGDEFVEVTIPHRLMRKGL